MPEREDLTREQLYAVITSQGEQITAQTEQIDAQAKTIAGLQAEVAQLKRQLSRNSGNSSNPPSTDDQPGRPAPNRRERRAAARRQGKQPGAPGHHLPWRENPDRTVSHYPTGICECGADLGGAADLGVQRCEQVHDIPPVTVEVTQHEHHRVRCACGREHVADGAPGMGAGPVSYGVNLAALVVYLLVFHHVPVARCAQLVADLTGATPSTGYVHSLLGRTAGELSGVVEAIKAAIVASPVVGFDETTLRAGPAGTKRYVLSANTELLTALHLGGRDLASFHAFGVLGSFAGIAVHDRYAVYDNPVFTSLTGHQLCAAHLLRDLQDAAESYPQAGWPTQAAEALRAAIHAANLARQAGKTAIPARRRTRLVHAFRAAVNDGLASVPRTAGAKTKQPPSRNLLECLHEREADVLRFTTDTRIWPTNNISERALRPEKTQQKISGRLQSETVTRHRLTIRSYLSTAAKHGVNTMTALRDALTGQPWTLPHPAPG